MSVEHLTQWVSEFVYKRDNKWIHSQICCSPDIDRCLEYTLEYNHSDELDQWKELWKSDVRREFHQELLNDMRMEESPGVNISFDSTDFYVDFHKIPCV